MTPTQAPKMPDAVAESGPAKKTTAAIEPKSPPKKSEPKAKKKKPKQSRRRPKRQVKKPKPREEPKPKPAPEPPKPARRKPKGGLLDFDDGDDAALAEELGLTKKSTASAKPKKKSLPPLSNADVLSVMRGHLAEFKACNRKQKKRDSSVKGKMVIKFTVENSGKVSTVQIRTAPFRGTYVAQCIMGVVKRLRFKESGGSPKQVPFPFTVK